MVPAMKISSVVVHRLSVPLPRPVRTAIHNHAHADTVVVELRSDAGAVGSGYCFAFGAKRAAALAALVEDLVPFYEGKDPAAVVAHFEAAWRSINFIGHSGLAVIALDYYVSAGNSSVSVGQHSSSDGIQGAGFWMEAVGPLPFSPSACQGPR